mgnify:CR=1 FL=1
MSSTTLVEAIRPQARLGFLAGVLCCVTAVCQAAPNPQDGSSNAVLAKLVWENGPHRVRLTGEYLDSAVETQVLTGLGPAFTFGPNPVWTVDALNARDTTERMRASLDWTYDGSSDDAIEYAFLSAYWQDAEDWQFALEERTTLTATPAPDRERCALDSHRG